MHVFIAPKTWYFSATSARGKSMFGSIFMTKGCRKLLTSVLGWMNWKSRSSISEGSSRGITSSGLVKISAGTWSPPLVAARYLLCILKRTSSDDLKVISAFASQTDSESRSSHSSDLRNIQRAHNWKKSSKVVTPKHLDLQSSGIALATN